MSDMYVLWDARLGTADKRASGVANVLDDSIGRCEQRYCFFGKWYQEESSLSDAGLEMIESGNEQGRVAS